MKGKMNNDIKVKGNGQMKRLENEEGQRKYNY